jgi:dolichol-phosphate mannosyltransferase
MTQTISVVTPVFNEETNIVALVDRVLDVLAPLPYEVEIIIADDGSGPTTARILDDLCRRRPEVGVVRLSRNFGHQAALTAGIDHARGDAVIVMDSDLQHPPILLPQMLQYWQEGFDVVYTVREEDETVGVLKRITSRVFYQMFNAMSDTEVPARAADFRLMSRAAADALRGMRERARFLRGLSVWIGFPQIAISYKAASRASGRSKFSVRKMLKLGTDGILSMSTLPLRIALWLGMALSSLSFAYLVYIIWAFFFTNRAIVGWSSLIVAILFLGGLQINILGIIGLYIAKTYEETKQRPIYIVREKVGRLA